MSRMKTEQQLQEELERLESRAQRKRAQLQKRQALDASRERDKRTHALIVFGAMVEKACGGDWKRVDPELLQAFLEKSSGRIKAAATDAIGMETLGYAEANRRIRAFESRGRKNAKAWDDPRTKEA